MPRGVFGISGNGYFRQFNNVFAPPYLYLFCFRRRYFYNGVGGWVGWLVGGGEG